MLDPMHPAAACHALLALAMSQAVPAPAPPASAPPAPVPASPAPVPASGAPTELPRAPRADERASREAKLLADLAPAPIAEERIRAIATSFAVAADAATAVDAAIAQYAAQTTEAHARALSNARARLNAGFRASTGPSGLSPQPGPELAELLSACAEWRRTLGGADDALLRQLASLRAPESPRCPGVARWERAMERDDLPAEDPGAALRLTDLVDAAQLAPADRGRVEAALDRQWAAVASAVALRRQAVADADAQRARLLEQWGAAWELTAAEATTEERLRELERLDARGRAAESPLREANRAAAMALLRLLPPEAADRVRDASDRTLWPWIFEAERALAETVRKAGEIAGPALADPLDAMMRDLAMRLAGTRRELARRASAAEELGTIVASAEAGAPVAELIPALEARIRLHELLARRLRLITEATRPMQQAAAGDPRTKTLLDERVESLRALARTHQWEQRGLLARIAELGAPAPSDPPAPEGR